VKHGWILWAAPVATAYLATSPLSNATGPSGTKWVADAIGMVGALVLAAAAHSAEELVGVVTVAQAHRAEAVAAVVARAEGSFTAPSAVSAAVSG
jgi:hypothetical protein